MDIFSQISRFLFRIRYKLIFGSLLATILAIYLTQFIPKEYSVTTTIFTGITSKTSLSDMSDGADWNVSNNAHDNIINLVKSKSTLESISMGLLAQHLIYGDPNKDNNYISAAHYKKLIKIVPKEVLDLVDKSSEERTIENFKRYKVADPRNFIYGVFNWQHPHYSYTALSKITIKRKESSDMLEISYKNNDPGIAMNTVLLLNKELSKRYEFLLLSTSNDVIKYFEEQLKKATEELRISEDELVKFNTEHGIVNYIEQTKHLSALNNAFEARYEQILLDNSSSKVLLVELEKQMNTRATLIRENELFLSTLAEISSLNGKIAEMEVFGSQDASKLESCKKELDAAEKKIKNVSTNMGVYSYTKEGVAITDMVDQWLNELIKQAASTAEIEVMKKRKIDINEQYAFFSPVGPNLSRKDRTVKVAEEQYLTILHHLGLAHLKQKNILLSSGTLQIVSPPEFPLLVIPRHRDIYVLMAFLFSIIFICGVYLIIEMMDRTIRDTMRAEHLSSGKVLGVFPRNDRLKYRGYNKEVYRMATSCMANALSSFIVKGEPTIINMLSIEKREGKSFIAKKLKDYWSDLGFSVQYISYDKDFNTESKSFITTSSICDILPIEDKKPDIIIVEYAPLMGRNVPNGLLKEASANLLITDAQRIWKTSDQPIFDKLKETIQEGRLFLYLNNADRETTEEYTGQLPPYTKWRRISYRFFKLGITAKKI
ncbi:MAG: hypothetical protein RR132_07100 [Rikenellaceae bacterium]